MKLINGVILDMGSLKAGPLTTGSLDKTDLDFSCLDTLVENWSFYEYTHNKDTLSRIKDADIVITNKVVLDKPIFEQTPHLKLVCVAATGTNNIDLEAAKKQNISVCNVTAYATNSVIQHVFSLLLSLHTKICQYDTLVRNNEWEKSRHFCRLDYPVTELAGKTLGIIGYGELGRGVAKAARAFGLKVIVAQSLTANKKPGRVELTQLLAESDIISLHCPLSKETENLINKTTLALMKPQSILINTSRGGVVNESDLLQALKNKTIAAAGLDVLNQEPPRNNALINANLPNLIITPHIAWASQSSRQTLVNEICQNIEAYLAGTARNIVA